MFDCYRFKLHNTLTSKFLLALVWHLILWLCVVVEKCFLWKICAIASGLFLVLTRFVYRHIFFAFLGGIFLNHMLLMQFGLFCIFDGHGGAGAAKAASKLVPSFLCFIQLHKSSYYWIFHVTNCPWWIRMIIPRLFL